MKEKDEPWEQQLQTIVEELCGLKSLLYDKLDFLILVSKLEGLFSTSDFMVFRRTVFKSIDLLVKIERSMS